MWKESNDIGDGLPQIKAGEGSFVDLKTTWNKVCIKYINIDVFIMNIQNNIRTIISIHSNKLQIMFVVCNCVLISNQMILQCGQVRGIQQNHQSKHFLGLDEFGEMISRPAKIYAETPHLQTPKYFTGIGITSLMAMQAHRGPEEWRLMKWTDFDYVYHNGTKILRVYQPFGAKNRKTAPSTKVTHARSNWSNDNTIHFS